jgi:hypothetical protein
MSTLSAREGGGCGLHVVLGVGTRVARGFLPVNNVAYAPAAEDVGLADPHALVQAVSAHQAAQLIGMPECNVVLAQCAVYLARAPKSNALEVAYANARQCVMSQPAYPGMARPPSLRCSRIDAIHTAVPLS